EQLRNGGYPDDRLARQQALARAQLKDYKAAAGFLEELSGRAPADQTVLRDLALAWLKGDELEKYRGLCTEQLAKHAGGEPLPEVANALAWLCVLDPGGREPLPKAHWERVVALAHSAQERDPDNDAYRTTLGAAYLRSGKAQEAIKFLRQADRELPA